MTVIHQDNKQITTYTAWNLFRNCRKAFDWRYNKCLVPKNTDHNLYFGSLIHHCLELWHAPDDQGQTNQAKNSERVFQYINDKLASRDIDAEQQKMWHLATAMMMGYIQKFADDPDNFKVISLEQKFEGDIINPRTGAKSKTFKLAGKIDGIVQMPNGDYWLMEHKTTSSITEDYINRLAMDFQIILYSHYAQQFFGFPITGILYNVLEKTKMAQKMGETEEEFEARRSELILKSKTGKSTAKRQMPETDEEFQARLAQKYQAPDTQSFHREWLYISQEQHQILQLELWELAMNLLDARRKNLYYQNDSYCFAHHRPCDYWELCRSGGNPAIIEAFYDVLEPHRELTTVGEAEIIPCTIPGVKAA